MTMTTGDMVGSYGTWESGYTGAGMRIAVIDTGLDLDHPSFDPAAYDYALSQLEGDWDLLDQTEIAQVLPRLTIAKDGLTAADLYRNTKVAFGYNYVDGDLILPTIMMPKATTEPMCVRYCYGQPVCSERRRLALLPRRCWPAA